MTGPLNARDGDIIAYTNFNRALDRLLDSVRDRTATVQDEIRAAGVAAFVVAMTPLERQQMAGLLGVLLAQMARGSRPDPRHSEECSMPWPFSRKPTADEKSQVDTSPDRAEVLERRIDQTELVVARLLASLRRSHNLSAGVDLSASIDLALDVLNTLRPPATAPEQTGTVRSE